MGNNNYNSENKENEDLRSQSASNGVNEENETKEEREEIELIFDEEGDLPDLQKKIKKIKESLKQCEAGKKEYLGGWQRTKADFINYKKDEGKRFEDMARFVISGLIENLIPVLDSFDLALGHGLSPETERGVLLIRSQMEDILKKRGLEYIMVKVGDKFDPEKHESVGEIESDLPEGMIGEEVRKGYILQGRVFRATKVNLSKGRAQ